MNWSKWILFQDDYVSKHVPANEGIYRLRVSDDIAFKLERGTDSSVFWKLVTEIAEADKLKLEESEPLLTYKARARIMTFLAYAGTSEKGSLKKRLLRHLGPKGNQQLKGIMDAGVVLFVSYMESANPDDAEQKFIAEYAAITGGFYPPCDCDGNMKK